MVMAKAYLFLFLLSFISAISFSQTVILHPVKDNTIYSENGTKSNATGAEFFVGETGSIAGQAKRRGLLQFNVSAIPAGSVITSASLSVTCTKVPPSAAPDSIELHKGLATWGEGTSFGSGNGGTASVNDATWTCRFANGTGGCTQTWNTAGGDFSAIVSSGATVNGAGVYTLPSSPALIADVQKWVDTAALNFGWIMIGDEATAYTARGFSSREGAPLATTLTITYSAAPCTTNTWTGAVNTAWENAGNWSCNSVPDSITNVVISSGTVVLNSNKSVRSFVLNPGVSFTVRPGFNLTITH